MEAVVKTNHRTGYVKRRDHRKSNRDRNRYRTLWGDGPLVREARDKTSRESDARDERRGR